MKWGHNLIFLGWQALSGSVNASPARHACDGNGGRGLGVTVRSILQLQKKKKQPKVNCILIKIQTAAFSAVAADDRPRLHVWQVRQIFTKLDTSSYWSTSRGTNSEAESPEMTLTECTEEMNDAEVKWNMACLSTERHASTRGTFVILITALHLMFSAANK